MAKKGNYPIFIPFCYHDNKNTTQIEVCRKIVNPDLRVKVRSVSKSKINLLLIIAILFMLLFMLLFARNKINYVFKPNNF